jgi:hypothetical protein
MAPWFVARFENHVGIALKNVFDGTPGLKQNESFLAAAKWLRDRLTGD